MRTLRYAINVTLDGCVDHRAGTGDEEIHRHAADSIGRAGGLLFGRVTYEMMESAWRLPAEPTEEPEPFARTIHEARKHVVSRTLSSVGWNAELVQGDLATAVRALKEAPGGELLTGGVTLPAALAELGLLDVVELVVLPRVAGHGPRLLEGLSTPLDLRLVDREELGNGAVAERYEVRRTGRR
ncbi:MAG TPA: dihydrofolate reductase family protein [Nocardioides sp.]